VRLRFAFRQRNPLRAAHGDDAFEAALDRAVAFGRWRAADVRSIRFALVTGRWRTLQHITASPGKIGDIARAALVLTHFEHGYIK
jgi:hypothetical protein